jgi:hypothetical protein
MSGLDGDSELDDFLARRSPMHRRLADGDVNEPPAELDRIVLAKAREAIKRPSETPVYRAPQWAMPVGLAASVLLVFAVVLNFARIPRQSGSAVAPVAADAPADARAISSEQAHVAKEAELTTQLDDAKAEADAAPSAVPARESLLAKSNAALSPELGAEQEMKPSSPALARDATSPAPASAESATAIGSTATSDSPLLASGGAVGATRYQQVRSDAANAAYTASADSSPVVGSFDEVAVTSARRARGKRTTATGTPAAIATEKARHADPEEWLREIERLRAAGRDTEAKRELEAFRKAYPEHPTQSSGAEPRLPAK